jgi:hypothetical protein
VITVAGRHIFDADLAALRCESRYRNDDENYI